MSDIDDLSRYIELDEIEDYDDLADLRNQIGGSKQSNQNRRASNYTNHKGKQRGSGYGRENRYSRKRNRRRNDPDKAIRYHRRKKHKILKKVIIALLILVVVAIGYAIVKYGKLKQQSIDGVKTYHSSKNYTNIALFGLDSRDADTGEGNRSDTIIVASINNSNHKVKLTSVLRDTFLEFEDGSYDKLNAAYSYGGAAGAINVINKNLDLDIEYYMTITFDALVEAVDAVGGVDIELTEDEIFWLNGYQVETAESCNKIEEVEDLPLQDGTYKLNGVQATSFCRIRYIGNDMARTNRQRIVLEALMKKVKSNPFCINRLIDNTFPHITTNISSMKFLSMAMFALFYNLDNNDSFPFAIKDYDMVYGYEQSFVIPDDLEENVVKLHKEALEEVDYFASDDVKRISDYIKEVAYY